MGANKDSGPALQGGCEYLYRAQAGLCVGHNYELLKRVRVTSPCGTGAVQVFRTFWQRGRLYYTLGLYKENRGRHYTCRDKRTV